MKKKKGFTLIELLAVIVILGVIALIVTPVIIGVINRQERKTFETSIRGIMRAIDIDLSDDSFNVPREYYYSDGALTLISVGGNIKNEEVKTNGKYDGEGHFYVDIDGDIIIDNACNENYCANKDKDTDLEIEKNDGTNHPEKEPNDPVITLNGDKVVGIGIGMTYTEEGAVAKTVEGTILDYETVIKKGTEVVESIDTSTESTYMITYSATSNHKTVTVTRIVKVMDTKPIIKITKADEKYVQSKSIKMEVIPVSPNTVSSFTYSINGTEEVVTGTSKTITLDQTGEYIVVINVTDNNGNSSELSSGTYKIDTIKPELILPENSNVKITEALTYNLLEGVSATDNTGITPEITVDGNLRAVLGEYDITYKATDEAGNIETKVRKITVVAAEGPILGQSNAGSNTWTKDQTIEITAVDNDSNISSFTYKITKDNVVGSIQNGTINGKNASASITLSETGIYYIDYTGIDGYNNPTSARIGPFKIDKTNPILGSATPVGTIGSNGWYTSNITFTVTNGGDAHSGHNSTVTTPTSITSNTTGTAVTIKTTDNVGNSVTGTVGTYKVDKTVPTITLKSTASETIVQGTSKAITDYFTITSTTSYSGSTTVCRDGTSSTATVVTNTSSLAVGTHTIRCTVTRGSGLSAYKDKTIVVNAANADKTGAEKPQITNGLVPIKWNGSAWIVADRNNTPGANQWYDYNTQMWANAASVTSSYRNAAVGTVVPESAILAYFVWIPRYEYMYTNLGTSYAGGTKEQPGEIKINFIAKNKTTATSNYKIHPAFNFGGTELSGIWVGKFETSTEQSSSCYTNSSVNSCDNSNQMPYIKPNVNSLRYQILSNQFATARKFSSSGNSYGISVSADAHMMKNSEWGAVAYLSQSKYGKYGNSSYSGMNKEIYINNYWSNEKMIAYGTSITGCSGGSPNANISTICSYTYEKEGTGTGASTTGTIYGVYDMSGGAVENVMGVYRGSDAASSWGASVDRNYAGFTTAPASKYYDEYKTNSETTACNDTICYGHALSETNGWYKDLVFFINSASPWLRRGERSNSSSAAGIFSFSSSAGWVGDSTTDNITTVYYTFRVVLLGDV